MHSTFNRGLAAATVDLPNEVEFFCLAADLLRQMLAELGMLAMDSADLAYALSCRNLEAHEHLCALHRTVELLVRADDRLSANSLKHEAAELICWLSDEIDELSLYANDGKTASTALALGLH